MRTLAIALATATLAVAYAPAPADARACVTAGRQIRHREHVTCAKAKRVARHYFAYAQGPSRWQCQGYKGQAWRGYCEGPGDRYFDWHPYF